MVPVLILISIFSFLKKEYKTLIALCGSLLDCCTPTGLLLYPAGSFLYLSGRFVRGCFANLATSPRQGEQKGIKMEEQSTASGWEGCRRYFIGGKTNLLFLRVWVTRPLYKGAPLSEKKKSTLYMGAFRSNILILQLCIKRCG